MTFLISSFVWACSLASHLAEILRLPACGKFDGHFYVTHNGHRLIGSSAPISMKSPTLIDCHYSCIKYPKCKALAFNLKKSLCELYNSDLSDSKTKLIKDNNWDYKESEKDPLNLGPVCNEKTPCKNGGKCRDLCVSPGFKCVCKEQSAGLKYGSDCSLNIAYKKPAESFRETPDYAFLAVDGDLKTYIDFRNNLWWTVDFGAVHVIDRITLNQFWIYEEKDLKDCQMNVE